MNDLRARAAAHCEEILRRRAERERRMAVLRDLLRVRRELRRAVLKEHQASGNGMCIEDHENWP